MTCQHLYAFVRPSGQCHVTGRSEVSAALQRKNVSHRINAITAISRLDKFLNTCEAEFLAIEHCKSLQCKHSNHILTVISP
jgi:hypothetical protein